MSDFEMFTAILDLCGVAWNEGMSLRGKSRVLVGRYRGVAFVAERDRRRTGLVRFSGDDCVAKLGKAARDMRR